MWQAHSVCRSRANRLLRYLSPQTIPPLPFPTNPGLIAFPPSFMITAASEVWRGTAVFPPPAKGFLMRACRRSLLALVPVLVVCGHLLSGCDTSSLNVRPSGDAAANREYLFCF